MKVNRGKRQVRSVRTDVNARIEGGVTAKGRRRFPLSKNERTILQKKQLANQALILFTETSKTIPEIEQELGLDAQALQEFYLSPEYPLFKEAVAERAAGMYLDIQRAWSLDEIANALGMSAKRLRTFVRTDPVFKKKYGEIFARITEDPGPRSIQMKVVENLLPAAYNTLRDELSPTAPWGVRQKARQDVFRLAGVEQLKPSESDRQEVARFLTQFGDVNINVNVPDEYREAVAKYLPASTAPGEPSQSEGSPAADIADGVYEAG